MSTRRMPDPGSLIAGVAFTGIGLTFLVGKVELAERARWVWPIVLLGLGAGLLAAVLRRPAEPSATGPEASATAAAAMPASAPAAPADAAGPEESLEPSADAIAGEEPEAGGESGGPSRS